MASPKRELAALWSARTGFTALLEHLPQQRLLVVLNHHRIGDQAQTPYDSGNFSATPEELDDQLTALKKRFDIITLEEALWFAHTMGEPRRACVLITFDDGYLDNYTTAFPILRSHGVQGVFFLPTAFIGGRQLPWWDVIAYIVKQGRRRIQIAYPEPAVFDLDRNDLDGVLRDILALFKKPAMKDPEYFITGLEEACGVSRPGESAARCFLDWHEAREMQKGGMAFGSHTHSHEILSKLPEEGQYDEMVRSGQILASHLKGSCETLAYPVGRKHTFSELTISALRRAGYRAAFSNYGGLNRTRSTNPFDIRRYSMDRQSVYRLRLQTALGAATGNVWF